VTVDRVLRLRPCAAYSRDRLLALWGGREALSLREISGLPISHEDRVWALVRLVTRRQRVQWACDCAERVLQNYTAVYPDDDRPAAAIRAARAWAGAPSKERRSAAESAWSAAESAESKKKLIAKIDKWFLDRISKLKKYE